MNESDKTKKEEGKASFTVPEIKSQEITVQNALGTPLCPSDPIDSVCGTYGS